MNANRYTIKTELALVCIVSNQEISWMPRHDEWKDLTLSVDIIQIKSYGDLNKGDVAGDIFATNSFIYMII